MTEGYGVLESEAYPSLLEEKLNKELSPKTNLRYKVLNGGISGATTSGGVSRIEWFLQAKPDYLLVALGGNDGLRGIPVEEMKKNIDRILKAARQNEIPTMLAGMKIPPNYGPEYSAAFAQAFEDLAEKTKFLDFLSCLKESAATPTSTCPTGFIPTLLVIAHFANRL